MNRFVLLIAGMVAMGIATAQTRHTITNAGFLFTPADLNVQVGDTVIFSLGGNHNAVEVAENTWNNNGATANNGFSIPFGGGKLIIDTAKTFFYVCEPHAGLSMKGKITASGATSSMDKSFAGRYKVFVTQNPLENRGLLTIEAPESGTGRYAISDLAGKVLIEREIRLAAGGNVFEIGFPATPASILFLQVWAGGQPLPAVRMMRQ